MNTANQSSVPLTDDLVSSLHAEYLTWIDDLTEIRERMGALRDETRIGWRPRPELTRALDHLNAHDKWFAARGMDTARSILTVAEMEAVASKPHRLARIDRFKERIAKLDLAYRTGWRPYAADKKWPDPEVVGWCAMFGGMRFRFVDDLESIVAHFEARLANARPKLQLGPKLIGRKRNH
jgi:hypothetical protein